MPRGAALAARMVAFQARAEREYAMAPTLTPQHIETLLRTYVRESLDEFERGLSWHPQVEAPGQLATERAWLDNARSDLETRLRTRDTRREVADARTFLAHAGNGQRTPRMCGYAGREYTPVWVYLLDCTNPILKHPHQS
jgi:hypothetical protein